MNQRNIIILGILGFLVLVGGIGAVYFFTQYKHVRFVVTDPKATAVLTESADSPRQSGGQQLHNDSVVWLKKQTYYAHFTDTNKFSAAPQTVTINDQTTTVTLDPSLSDTALSSALQAQRSAIAQTIQSSVKGADYAAAEGQLYHRGEWYATTLTVYKATSSDPDIANPDNADTYYIVLKKDADTWKVVAGPSLIITKPDNPNIPSYIIDTINPAQALL